jgi:hypothetical protein
MMKNEKGRDSRREPLGDASEAKPIMSFTRLIGRRAGTGAFDGWGPRMSPDPGDTIKPD